eukprot:GEMP01057004.1.p1 GENE.GEMP01057004.1~~GEMP01057004.1.p1  ORF type:complete len:261 (+),score=42.06 GEMP01057004.1:53-784(+)
MSRCDSPFAARPVWHPSGLRQSVSMPTLIDPINPIRMQSIRIKDSWKYKEMKNFEEGSHFTRTIGRAGGEKCETALRGDKPKKRAVGSITSTTAEFFRPRSASASGLNMVDKLMESRENWQHSMNSCISRLLVDLNLAMGKPHDLQSHRSRVNFMDDAHAWYQKVGQKQARKARVGAPFLRFQPDDPPIPGSLRPYNASEFRWRLHEPPPVKDRLNSSAEMAASDKEATEKAAAEKPTSVGSP